MADVEPRWLPNQVACPECDRRCSGSWSFCPSCGAAIEDGENDE